MEPGGRRGGRRPGHAPKSGARPSRPWARRPSGARLPTYGASRCPPSRRRGSTPPRCPRSATRCSRRARRRRLPAYRRRRRRRARSRSGSAAAPSARRASRRASRSAAPRRRPRRRRRSRRPARAVARAPRGHAGAARRRQKRRRPRGRRPTPSGPKVVGADRGAADGAEWPAARRLPPGEPARRTGPCRPLGSRRPRRGRAAGRRRGRDGGAARGGQRPPREGAGRARGTPPRGRGRGGAAPSPVIREAPPSEDFERRGLPRGAQLVRTEDFKLAAKRRRRGRRRRPRRPSTARGTGDAFRAFAPVRELARTGPCPSRCARARASRSRRRRSRSAPSCRRRPRRRTRRRRRRSCPALRAVAGPERDDVGRAPRGARQARRGLLQERPRRPRRAPPPGRTRPRTPRPSRRRSRPRCARSGRTGRRPSGPRCATTSPRSGLGMRDTSRPRTRACRRSRSARRRTSVAPRSFPPGYMKYLQILMRGGAPRFRLGGGTPSFGSFFLILMYFYFSLDMTCYGARSSGRIAASGKTLESRRRASALSSFCCPCCSRDRSDLPRNRGLGNTSGAHKGARGFTRRQPRQRRGSGATALDR